MADYILGIILIGLFIVAARSYFGTRFKGSCCDRCSGCPHAQGCKSLKK
ncbi:FeoB-associated Cys-rich membrane protein [Phascolarctobacterium sp.]